MNFVASVSNDKRMRTVKVVKAVKSSILRFWLCIFDSCQIVVVSENWDFGMKGNFGVVHLIGVYNQNVNELLKHKNF